MKIHVKQIIDGLRVARWTGIILCLLLVGCGEILHRKAFEPIATAGWVTSIGEYQNEKISIAVRDHRMCVHFQCAIEVQNTKHYPGHHRRIPLAGSI